MQLEINDLLNFKAEEKVLYALDSERKVKLYVCLNGDYQVLKDGALILRSMQPYDAIEKFNEC